MKNNVIYSHNHFKFFENIILKKRYEIIEIIKEQINLNKINDVLDVGTTSDEQNTSSNLIVKSLTNVSEFHSISDQKITSSFFKKTLQKSITEDFSEEDIKKFRSDLVISSATIEHVGNNNNQKMMLSNMIKLSKNIIIITTPNRFHPVDFHTKIPFIHWLPKTIHRKILKFLNLSFYSKEENLNLLSKSDFIQLAKDENITYEFKYIRLLGFVSNLIFIGKKN
jgi:ABC-type sugar transport system ATPase subunit